MSFKEFLKMNEELIEEYQERLKYLNNCDYPYQELDSIEERFFSDDSTLYDMFYNYEIEDIREKIGEVIRILIQDDERYNEDCRDRYFELDYNEDLKKDLAQKILNTDDSIFFDETLKSIFMIIKFGVEDRKNLKLDYADIYRFEEDVIPEIFYLAIRENQKLLNEFEEENHWVKFRKKLKMDWEKFL